MASTQGNAAAKQHLVCAKARWQSWVKEKLKGGAAEVHRFVKRVAEVPLVLDGPLDQIDASPAAVLKRDQNVWKEVWTRLSGSFDTPWTRDVEDQSGKLQAITKEGLREAAKTFSARTGVGEDWFRPRDILLLSDSVLDRCATVVNRAESIGEWPSLVANNLVHLIPKPTGGMRPIGLMAMLVRLYERVRRPDIHRWRAACDDPATSDAVWVQSVRVNASKELGRVSASVMLDFIKSLQVCPPRRRVGCCA